jgi:hypothetical protein
MAKVRDNVITEGLSGKLGKRLVFRRGKGGSTIVALRGTPPENPEYSDAQVAQQEAFKDASKYAQEAQTQSLYKTLARGTESSAYNLAVADWFGKPEVLSIDASAWTGQAGQTIRMEATDDTKVTNVHVVIHNNGTVLEEGDAEPVGKNVLLWSYVTTTNVTPAQGLLLDANAYDMAGNFGAMSVSLN